MNIDNNKSVSRRSFTKKALGIGFLSSLAIMNLPGSADAWLDEKIMERDDLADGIKELIKTYDTTSPYPVKFYDGLVRVHLRNLDFAVKKGLAKEHADHYSSTLAPMIEKYVKNAIPIMGKDIFLWANFERTSCSYQLYEHIDIKENERSVPCPFKSILEYQNSTVGTYSIKWGDVCNKWCIPVWENFANMVQLKIKVEPGETCRITLV
ncbi:MAG: hypothetical protein HZA77_04850 [Candidatus Schekmanbacteria bacterium]|nr:hypothetical protein [Candidatus Schekmanbacteria bacterium]